MKYAMIAILSFGFSGVPYAADAPAAPESENDKAIYSLGYELGREVKGNKLEMNQNVLMQGAKDAMEGNRPLVDARQRQKALNKIKEQREQENQEKSQAYLAENAKKEGVVTLPSGLQYRVIQAGEGKMPGGADSVTVHYRGSFINGVEFDSSYQRDKPSTFQVKKVIKGWTEALQLMKEGAKWELVIPPELAYGKNGRGKRIPPNSALVFEVELLSVK
ncbi:MAG: peptidylprolyl isomerase [Sedimenticola sp.]|nr:MAG: peptidylprolyl isomerase [Sedimenticola sp.]